jgi:microcystin-dependent protein
MGAPYVGEVRAFAFGFEPTGWAECNGDLMPIMTNQPLFSLIGTIYGGNGETDFALPNIPPLEAGIAGVGLKWRIAIAGEQPPQS